MTSFDFEASRTQWDHPPVGGRNQSSQEVLDMAMPDVRRFVASVYRDQYSQDTSLGENTLGAGLGLLDTRDSVILDYGCGFGLDALTMARSAGNRLLLADIVATNAAVASRILHAYHLAPAAVMTISSDPPFLPIAPASIDVFLSNGVLHHTPRIVDILRRAADWLRPGGEIRLMLYSDVMWREATGTELPAVDSDVADHPSFGRYVRFCDAVGTYADWYSPERLEARVGEFLATTDIHYIGKGRRHIIATFTPRPMPFPY